MTWIRYHEESERLAADAETAMRRGKEVDARKLYAEAAEREVKALSALDCNKIRTLGITVVSVASLLYKAKNYMESEKIAREWVGKDNLPGFARQELQSLILAIDKDRLMKTSPEKVIMVIALQQFRTELGPQPTDSLSLHVKEHGRNLESFSAGLCGGSPPLFSPKTASLWGSYDHATFFLSDDFESVARLSHCAASPSQEFLFGCPVGENQSLKDFFDPSFSESMPIIAIARLKLGDHLLSFSGELLRETTAGLIEDTLKKDHPNVHSIILRCWAWPDIIAILSSRDLMDQFKVLSKLESISIGQLAAYSSKFQERLEEALEMNDTRTMLGLWTQGPSYTQIPDSKLRRGINDCHAFVALRTHLGFRNEVRNFVGSKVPLEPSAEGSVKQSAYLKEMELTKKKAESSARMGVVHASVSAFPKLGHLRPVHEYLVKVKELCKPWAADVRHGNSNRGTCSILDITIPSSAEALSFLLCISESFRSISDIQSHVLAVTTRMRLDGYVPDLPSPNNATYGFRLLQPQQGTQRERYERRRIASQGIGHVENVALCSSYAAIMQASAQPELLGAMAHLQDAAEMVYCEMLHGRHEGELQEIRDNAAKVVAGFQQAYQQRIEFSPVLSGAPPINGQLPFGLNQMVKVLDGVSCAILATAELGAVAKQTWPFGSKACIVCEADPAIAVRFHGPVIELRTNILQALTPLSLTVLFHELGHLMMRRYLKENDRKETDWRKSLVWLNQCIPDKVCKEGREELWLSRAASFASDIIANSAWRVLGAANDWGVFQTQFLAGQAMGLRLGGGLAIEGSAFTSWSETALHLHIQNKLFQNNESLANSLGEIADSMLKIGRSRKKHNYGPFFDENFLIADGVMPFAECELRRDTLRGPDHGMAKLDGLRMKLGNIALERLGLPVLPVLAKASEVQDTRDMLQGAINLIGDVGKILRKEEDSHDLSGVSLAVKDGQTANHSMEGVVDKEGDPTPRAFLMLRQVLKGVTLAFQKSSRDPVGCLCMPRDSRLLSKTGSWRPQRGVWTDMAGGLFAVGKKERGDYLAVRIAALSALEDLAERLSVAPIRRRLKFSRGYLRFAPKDFCETEVIINLEMDGRTIPANLINFSAKGLRVRVTAPVKIKGKDETRFHINSVEDKNIECIVRWPLNEETNEFGAEIAGPPQETDLWMKKKSP